MLSSPMERHGEDRPHNHMAGEAEEQAVAEHQLRVLYAHELPLACQGGSLMQANHTSALAAHGQAHAATVFRKAKI